MKKRGGRYCNAINTSGYARGHHCCARAKFEGPDGKGYCAAHIAPILQAIALAAEGWRSVLQRAVSDEAGLQDRDKEIARAQLDVVNSVLVGQLPVLIAWG